MVQEKSNNHKDLENGGDKGNGEELTSFMPQQSPVLKTLAKGNIEILPDNLCGIFSYHPKWLQKFASKKSFTAVFSMLAIVQVMSSTYLSSTITTLEKRFKISSQTTGIVLTGNEISQIIFAIVLAYYGSKGHRPHWMAAGVLMSAASCFLLATPHFLYGPGNGALSITEEYSAIFETGSRVDVGSTTPASIFHNLTSVSSTKSKIQMCKRGLQSTKLDDCEASDTSIVPMLLIFLSQFVLGIGVLIFYTLGGPYLDDNIKKTKTPMVIGITISMRLLGPTFGFLLGGFCLKIFINPLLTPTITVGHPQWLGAWWLGWIFLGTFMIFAAFLIALFPRELPRATQLKKQATIQIQDEKPKLSELPKKVKRLLTNKTNLFNTLSGVFYLFANIGYWTYMPKYLETIFMQTATNASVITGAVSLAFLAVGLLASGALISKYQPSARFLAAWNVVGGIVLVISKICYTQLGCDPGELAFGQLNINTGEWNLTVACNLDCNCRTNKVYPVCHRETNQVYYSACHAGCTGVVEGNGTVFDCACVTQPNAELSVGTCNEGCFTSFVIFLGVNAFIKLLDGTGRIGNLLVSYRCVDPKDKSLAIGLNMVLISLFAMLPSPILFGKIFDAACLVWGTKCGQRGNCWLYDGPKLRYWFNLFAAGFMFLGALFDGLVWYYVKDLDLYDEEKNVRIRLERIRIKKIKSSEKH